MRKTFKMGSSFNVPRNRLLCPLTLLLSSRKDGCRHPGSHYIFIYIYFFFCTLSCGKMNVVYFSSPSCVSFLFVFPSRPDITVMVDWA